LRNDYLDAAVANGAMKCFACSLLWPDDITIESEALKQAIEINKTVATCIYHSSAAATAAQHSPNAITCKAASFS